MRIAAFLLISATLFAQNDRGTITGTVTDPTNAIVPNVTVIATQAGTGVTFKAVTTATGNYYIPSLPAGNYSLSVEAAGFKRLTQEGIVVQVAQTVRLDVVLQVGATSEAVTITAE